MWWWIVIAWWAFGTTSMLWLRRGDDLTWAELLLCMIMGFVGPILWALIGLVILSQAEFWSQPIFKRKDKDDA